MTKKTVQVLIAIVVGLALLLLVLRSDDLDDTIGSGTALLPGLKAVANDVVEVRMTPPEDVESVTMQRKDGQWVVSSRSDYAADLGKLRQLIIALTDAEIVEEKTSNPELYGKLGVDNPDAGGKGTAITLTAPDSSFNIVLGNTAQGSYRYARVEGDATSYLIDQNPELPRNAGEWLAPDIIDVSSSDVRRVVIAHADGETITIEKTDEEQTDFDVTDVPEGRELSYATVGNGVGGALAKLELDDVRVRVEAPAVTTTVYETWDDIKISIDVVSDDDTDWLGFSASLADDESEASEKVAAINERLAGWQYNVADYKKNLLKRRWDDILKSTEQ